MKGFTGKEVIDLYTELEAAELPIWIDGGWAIDALLGEQTRPHEDLDIAIEKTHLNNIKDYLESRGYKEVKSDYKNKWDLVLADHANREIEIHSFTKDENGVVIDQPYWDGYSHNSLTGTGTIEGYTVRCVSLEQLIKTHNPLKRAMKETDYVDMEALRKKFGLK